jgi:hypothetical protein
MHELVDRLRRAANSAMEAARLADIWADADEMGRSPEWFEPNRCREAAGQAMAEIDRALWELHQGRAVLLSQIHRTDDAHGRHVDAFLARLRKGDR